MLLLKTMYIHFNDDDNDDDDYNNNNNNYYNKTNDNNNYHYDSNDDKDKILYYTTINSRRVYTYQQIVRFSPTLFDLFFFSLSSFLSQFLSLFG